MLPTLQNNPFFGRNTGYNFLHKWKKVILSPVYPSSVIRWVMQAKAVDRKCATRVRSKDEKRHPDSDRKTLYNEANPRTLGISFSMENILCFFFIIGMIHCRLKVQKQDCLGSYFNRVTCFGLSFGLGR